MAVGGDGDFVDTVDVVDEIFDFLAEFRREAVACRVGYIDYSGSGFDYGFDDTGKILVVGAACILGIELDILDEAFGIGYGLYSALDDFLTVGIGWMPW